MPICFTVTNIYFLWIRGAFVLFDTKKLRVSYGEIHHEDTVEQHKERYYCDALAT